MRGQSAKRVVGVRLIDEKAGITARSSIEAAASRLRAGRTSTLRGSFPREPQRERGGVAGSDDTINP
jgi:hypothetical protein